MTKKSIYKVPNGKLLKIFLEEKDGAIATIKITGDFFMYPEQRVEEIEAALAGIARSGEKIRARLEDFFKAHPTSLFGLDTEALVYAITAAQ